LVIEKDPAARIFLSFMVLDIQVKLNFYSSYGVDILI
jgi:hypothetical protein